MKKIPTTLIAILISILSFSQATWRDQEMEVRVIIEHEDDAFRLHELHLNGEVYPTGHALLYVIPEELQQLVNEGFSFEILKEDLNAYYKDFWMERDAYHTYDEIIQVMNSLSFGYSAICRKYDFGLSLEGRQLTALKISDNVNEDENEAEVMFDGGIHGDEIGGPENLIRFAQYLCASYGTDPDITDLIDHREIWLYVMVNPDGRVNMIRYNSNGVDLNRDWGYMWNAEGSSPAPFSQVETRALRDCLYDHQFVVHTTYHSGTEFLSYPWSYRPDPCPDNNHIDFLASIYASTSGYSNLPYEQGYTGMYAINGSSKDSYYGIMGSIGWTMEISNSKQPPSSQIQYYFEINLPAMLATIEHSGYGLQGTVTDAITGLPVAAMLQINDFYPAYNDPLVGDYHKYLTPGTYSVTVIASGYESQTASNVVINEESATTMDFSLQPGGGHYAWRMPFCLIPDNNYDDEGSTPAALGPPDNVRYSLGRGGYAILDMFEQIMDGPGDEIKVYENDGDPEGFGCYAGSSMDGPWIFLGNGTGTSTFDFSDAMLTEARFIKIVDDGNGPATGDNAGFDLDAVEALDQPMVVYFVADCLIDDPSGNNNHRIDPGESFELILTLRNSGGLAAEYTTGNLNYDSTWIVVPEPDFAAGTIAGGQQVQLNIPMTADAAMPPGSVIMMVLNLNANQGDYTQSLLMSFTAGPILEDWESNGFQQFPWSTGGSLPWTISFIGPYEGAYSAKSGNIDDGENSVLEITMDVIGYDDISFYRKVSTEPGFDVFRFYIDGGLVDEWSGVYDWELVTYQVTPGERTFKWEYIKNNALSMFFDCAWLDYITFPSCNLDGSLHALANAFPTQYCYPGESQLGAFVIGGAAPYNFSWSPPDSLSSPNAQFPTANPSETTQFTLTVNDNAFASAVSEIKLTVNPIPETPSITQVGDSLVSSYPEGNQWFDSQGMIEGADRQVYHPIVQDDFYVIVTSEAGCFSAPSNVIHFLFTDIEEMKESHWRVYPIPVGEYLYIMPGVETEGEHLVQIIDALGNILYSAKHSLNGLVAEKVYTGDLPRGIYFVSFSSRENGYKTVKKFIK